MTCLSQPCEGSWTKDSVTDSYLLKQNYEPSNVQREKLTPKHDSGPIELVFETDTPSKTREKLKGITSS